MKLVGTGRRGMTILEVVVVIAVSVLVVGLGLLPGMGRTCRCGTRQIKDSTQVRNIVQAMTIFANGNKDVYPLPSTLDVNNDTTATRGRAKDSTGNILSILIYNSYISPEICVSPAEASGVIMTNTSYQNANPTAAVVPAKALWDPGFTCDYTAPGGGNVSYGSLMTNDSRLSRWANTFNATEVVLGNRGPQIASYTRTYQGAAVKHVLPGTSITLAIHGGRTTWEGNIGYNDNHVNFETRVDPVEVTFTTAGGRTLTDVLFADDGEDPKGTNAYLGVWTRGGALSWQSRGIWD